MTSDKAEAYVLFLALRCPKIRHAAGKLAAMREVLQTLREVLEIIPDSVRLPQYRGGRESIGMSENKSR
ncbi:MAG: hypothetical protein ACE5FM_08035 [Methyloligellaceae bacterium]